MPNNKYISFILFLIISITVVNLYFKPNLVGRNEPIHWLEKFIDPITKSNCPLQGFKCPSSEPCDCEKFCNNGNEFVPFHIADDNQRVYVMNKKLTPGTYCLPKGVDKCNLNTNYHVFSLAGWSCLSLDEVIFKGDKKRACKNEEAENNDLNVLWDYSTNREAGDNIDDYYVPLGNEMRFRCKCGSKSLDGTPMISVFPFVCSVDYCLRDVPNPLPFMGWNGKACDCGPYFHLDPNDKTSPCRRQLSRVTKMQFIGRVDCMTEKSFVGQALFCPTADQELVFKENIMKNSSDVVNFIEVLNRRNVI